MTTLIPTDLPPLAERAKQAVLTARPVAELRLLDPPPATVRDQLEKHVLSLAVWNVAVETKGRSALDGTLLASEQREYDRRVRDIRELELRSIPTMTAAEARAAFTGSEGN